MCPFWQQLRERVTRKRPCGCFTTAEATTWPLSRDLARRSVAGGALERDGPGAGTVGAGWPFQMGGITPYLDRVGASERVFGGTFHTPMVRGVGSAAPATSAPVLN